MGKIHLVGGDSIPNPERALGSGKTKILYAGCMRCGKPILYSYDEINIALIKSVGANSAMVLCCPRCYRAADKIPRRKLV